MFDCSTLIAVVGHTVTHAMHHMHAFSLIGSDLSVASNLSPFPALPFPELVALDISTAGTSFSVLYHWKTFTGHAGRQEPSAMHASQSTATKVPCTPKGTSSSFLAA